MALSTLGRHFLVARCARETIAADDTRPLPFLGCLVTSQPPLVSVGLPVRNGANFLGEALDSLRAQTLRQFELIVSDNASTDTTPEILRRAKAVDPRVRYLRQDENIGAAANFNLVFNAARGKYFCWATHDDLWHPEFLARCAEVLDSDSEAILCFSGCTEVDANGREIARLSKRPDLGSEEVHIRFRDVMRHAKARPLMGLVRRDALRRTTLIQPRLGSDLALLAELALRGRFRELPETLFFSRQHPDRYGLAPLGERMQWWGSDIEDGGLLFPHWTRLIDYGRAIERVPLRREERRRCWAEFFVEAGRRWRPLLHDLRTVARDLVSHRTVHPSSDRS